MKIKIALATLAMTSFVLAKDMIVGVNALPQNSQNFIKQYFQNASVSLVKQDIDSFEVYLNDGTEIEFFINGDWKEVDANYKPLNTAFMPKNALSTITKMHPNVGIIKIEKEIQGYKFELNNRMEVYTDVNGNFLGQKFDD